MSENTSPHDSFCKEIMARPEVATDFLANYMPPDVVASLDINALELVKDSFVDGELRKHLSDLLYRVPFRDGSEAFIYILFEHKNRPDEWVAFQLLRYEMMIWEPIARRREGKLPPIFPIVFYHGQQRSGLATISDLWIINDGFTRVGAAVYQPGVALLVESVA